MRPSVVPEAHELPEGGQHGLEHRVALIGCDEANEEAEDDARDLAEHLANWLDGTAKAAIRLAG